MIFIYLVFNSFIKKRMTTKSKEVNCDLFIERNSIVLITRLDQIQYIQLYRRPLLRGGFRRKLDASKDQVKILNLTICN